MRDTTAVTQLRSTAQEEPGWLVAAQRPGVTLGTLSVPLAQREKWALLPISATMPTGPQEKGTGREECQVG